MKRQILIGALLIVVAAAVTTFAVWSPTAGTDSAPVVEASAPVDGIPGHAAMRAYLNPETGELEVGVAPANEADLDADTQNALRRDTEGLLQVHHADGSVSMDLQGRFQSVSVVRTNQDGTFTVCTDQTEGAKQALDGNTSVPITPAVK